MSRKISMRDIKADRFQDLKKEEVKLLNEIEGHEDDIRRAKEKLEKVNKEKMDIYNNKNK